jgi:hypothetical protein
MASPFATRRATGSRLRQLLVILAVVLLILAACLVGSLRLIQGCWLGVDCGPVTETETVSAVLVSPDGRTLSIQGSMPCSGQDTFTATEHPDRVVVADVWTGPAHSPGCTAAMGLGTWTAHLSAPLGNRQLIDAATGRPVPWIGGPSLLDPGYLPPGYRLVRADGRPPELLDDAFQSACSTRWYSSGPGPELVISECTGRLVSTTSPHSRLVVGQVTVAGTTAQIRGFQTAGGARRGLVWEVGDRTYVVATINEADGPLLPDKALVTIADGLR